MQNANLNSILNMFHYIQQPTKVFKCTERDLKLL